MPKLPRISSREAIRALKRLGFEEVRQTGSHLVLKGKPQEIDFTSRYLPLTNL
jgi:predicted RNA binding protein YcfA (HicA-like mRNA interferase family)